MFKMKKKKAKQKAVKCLVSYVLCIYATDLSVTDMGVQGLISSQFASITNKDSGQLPPQSLSLYYHSLV